MERKSIFTVGEFYHVYNRGVNKQNIFHTDADFKHFQRLLYTRNSKKRIDSERVKGLPLHMIDRGETIVEIIAYCCMRNHFHLLLHEIIDGGISIFMGKLGTAFSMYINTKYRRTGPLVCRPFRSRHIDSDEYFRWVFSYIHLNPIEIIQPDFKSKGVANAAKAKSFLEKYAYSSYQDYMVGERKETVILTKSEESKTFLQETHTLRGLLETFEKHTHGMDV